MKKILFILAACFCLALTGCQFEKDIDLDTAGGKGLEFIHFNAPSASWMVAAEDESFVYDVPVGCSYSYDTDKTYTIEIGEATTGVEGVDFRIPTKSVTIKAGEFIGTVPVEVLYETTGLGFVLELILKVEDKLVNPSYGASELISVKTDKVTIDWAWLEGNWTAQDWNYYSGKQDGDPYTMSFTKVDDTHVTVRNIWGSGAELDATVDFDARTITIAGNQHAFSAPQYGAECYFVAVDPDADYDTYDDITTPVVGVMSPAGVTFDNYDFLLVGGAYDGYTYAGGLRTDLTR